MLIISLSGGLASAANAILAAKSGEPYLMVFADTTIEDDDLYRFLYDIENHAFQIAERLLIALNQQSFSIQSATTTTWYSRR